MRLLFNGKTLQTLPDSDIDHGENRSSGVDSVKTMETVPLRTRMRDCNNMTLQFSTEEGTDSNADAQLCTPISAEKDNVIVGTLLLGESIKHHRASTQITNPKMALVYEGFLASFYKPTAEGMSSSTKATRRIWQERLKRPLEDEVLYYQEDAVSQRAQ